MLFTHTKNLVQTTDLHCLWNSFDTVCKLGNSEDTPSTLVTWTCQPITLSFFIIFWDLIWKYPQEDTSSLVFWAAHLASVGMNSPWRQWMLTVNKYSWTLLHMRIFSGSDLWTVIVLKEVWKKNENCSWFIKHCGEPSIEFSVNVGSLVVI